MSRGVADRRAAPDRRERAPSLTSGDALSYIISTDCMRCGVCEFMCPQRAIIEAKRQLIILKKLCDGCGECVPYCPVYAIVPRDQFKARQASTMAAQLRAALER